MNSRQRRGVAELQSALVIAVISMSMAYVVYSQSRVAHPAKPVFLNSTQLVEGTTPLLLVQSNGSRQVSMTNILVDGAPAVGILSFDGSGYSASSSLCVAGSTTFFSVLTASGGPVSVATDGRSWISGAWGASATVAPGWSEVMIAGGSSCTVTLPEGTVIASMGPRVSRVPVTGQLNASSFRFFIPWGGNGHLIQLVFSEGVDSFEA